MRITGYGGGFGQSPSGKEHADPEAFRRGRRVGQIVRGRLVAPGPNGLFWVVVAGYKLLASLDHDPIPNRELVFRILRLEPELILKDITPPPEAETDPALLLAALVAARSRFERRFSRSDLPIALPLDLTSARKRFFDWLSSDRTARDDFATVQTSFQAISSFLPAQEGSAIYTPWVFTGLRQSETLVLRHGKTADGPGFSLRLFGHLEHHGLLALQASWHPGRVVYRLMAEDNATSAAVAEALQHIRYGRAILTPTCLSVTSLPDAYAPGFLAKLVAASSQPFTGLRLRV